MYTNVINIFVCIACKVMIQYVAYNKCHALQSKLHFNFKRYFLYLLMFFSFVLWRQFLIWTPFWLLDINICFTSISNSSI